MGTSRSPCSAALLLALVVALTAPPLGADEPYLVHDIVPGIGGQFGSDPFLIQVADRVLLFADDEDHGRELWVTDGTPAGTRLIRDICPGRCSSEPEAMWSLGERLLFFARALPLEDPFPTDQHRLWASDGTFAGTRDLGTPPTFLSTSNPPGIGVLEDRGLFFFEYHNPPGEICGRGDTAAF